MSICCRSSCLIFTGAIGAAVLIATLAVGPQVGDAKKTKPGVGGGDPPRMPLPPGWTTEDMQACDVAGTPGPMHAYLAKQAGVWKGKNQMWMAAGTEPMVSECVDTVTTVMDGRFIKGEMVGDMAGMGTFNGLAYVGFDNVSGKFVGTWLDNHSTGIMNGVGTLSDDGKTMTWQYSYNCPITKKPTIMRQVETFANPNTRTIDMFTPDAKTGKEFKVMRLELTRAPATR